MVIVNEILTTHQQNYLIMNVMSPQYFYEVLYNSITKEQISEMAGNTELVNDLLWVHVTSCRKTFLISVAADIAEIFDHFTRSGKAEKRSLTDIKKIRSTCDLSTLDWFGNIELWLSLDK